LAALFAAAAQSPTAPPEGAGESRDDLAIVVHPKNDADDFTFDEMRGIFLLGEQYWPGRRRIVLLMPPSGSPEKDVLLKTLFKMKEEDLRKYWVQKLFAGEILAIPSVLTSTDRVPAALKQREGAISVMLKSRVPPGLKILAIDGKRPGDPDYPLRRDSRP
jgi:ABC-type phosphate transport system substrate-binding protein